MSERDALIEGYIDPPAQWEPVEAAAKGEWRWRGRFRSMQSVPGLQAGHRRSAFRIRKTGERDRLAIEDADYNQVASNTMESSGIWADRESVVIDGVVVDLATARMWARQREFPRLTPEMVEKAPRHQGWIGPAGMSGENAKPAFMREMLKIISSDPKHPLRPLIKKG
jgi:hypothetical protein